MIYNLPDMTDIYAKTALFNEKIKKKHGSLIGVLIVRLQFKVQKTMLL